MELNIVIFAGIIMEHDALIYHFRCTMYVNVYNFKLCACLMNCFPVQNHKELSFSLWDYFCIFVVIAEM